jgi:hypothetical protein
MQWGGRVRYFANVLVRLTSGFYEKGSIIPATNIRFEARALIPGYTGIAAAIPDRMRRYR